MFSLVLHNQDHVIFRDISEALRADIATYVHEDIAEFRFSSARAKIYSHDLHSPPPRIFACGGSSFAKMILGMKFPRR